MPGGPQKISEPSERVSSMRVSAPSGAEQMVLADHLGELGRPQPVGERPRRIALEAGGREQASALRARFWPRGRWPYRNRDESIEALAGGTQRATPDWTDASSPANTTDICWPPR